MNRNGKQAFPRVLISIALQKPGKVAVWVCLAFAVPIELIWVTYS